MRIIGGLARGQIIRAPAGTATRPTSDRVREAIFSIVLGRLGDPAGLDVLDLFAGSGALGLESLSRGFARATFVDSAPGCRRIIEANAAHLGFSARCQVLCQKVAIALGRLQQGGSTFHLILADPPYHDDPEAVLALVARSTLLHPEGLLVLEHDQRAVPPPRVPAEIDRAEEVSLELTTRKRYGDTAVSFYGRATGSTTVDVSR
jgi:16S rRNA (guanine966-N2)-methyltransferase